MINLEFRDNKCIYIKDLDGALSFDRALSDNHKKYLDAFFKTKRIIRSADLLSKVKDPVREAVNLPIGTDGCYFVSSATEAPKVKSIIDYNKLPSDQPSFWCAWFPSTDGRYLKINKDRAVCRLDWLQYMVENFFKPWGYSLSGKVKVVTDPAEYTETILVSDNKIEHIQYTAFL